MHAYFALSMVKYLTESSNINDFTKTFEQTSQHLTYYLLFATSRWLFFRKVISLFYLVTLLLALSA